MYITIIKLPIIEYIIYNTFGFILYNQLFKNYHPICIKKVIHNEINSILNDNPNINNNIIAGNWL